MSTNLEIRNISKHFGPISVLQDISLDFSPGTVTALVGDNGAGKSTLLKVIAGLHSASKGRITLQGETIGVLSAEERRARGVEMVYQDLALAPQQDVITNLFLGREMVSALGVLKRNQMCSLGTQKLRELGITIPDVSVPVGTLSGGQQQAIAIARAVLFSPRVLLLDEPTAALAAREVERVLELIRMQRAQSRITILVSHRLNDVLAVADRIIVLKRGCISADVPADSVSLAEIVEKIVS